MLTQEMIDRQLALEMESVQIGINSYRDALKKARVRGSVSSMPPEAAAIRAYMNPFLEGDRKSTGLIHIIGLGSEGYHRQNRGGAERVTADTFNRLVHLRDLFFCVNCPKR